MSDANHDPTAAPSTETRASDDGKGQLWLLGRSGERRVDLVADVALDTHTHQLYSYAVPDALAQVVRPGVAVRAPYGKGSRVVAGWCVRCSEAPWTNTRRAILSAATDGWRFSPALVELGVWVSEYYGFPPGPTLDAMSPAAVRDYEVTRTKTTIVVSRTAEPRPEKLTAKQTQLLDVIEGAGVPVPQAEALRGGGVTAAVLGALEKRGLVVRDEAKSVVSMLDEDDSESVVPVSPEDALVLTDHQQAALARIAQSLAESGGFRVFLLFGVPGSGKTEVYVRAIRAAVARDKQAILIVPEIALATQIVERLARRFARVAVLHSRLTVRERAKTLHRIARGAVDVVIGTRTAVFAPCAKLGLIIVDEEQEGSLKNIAAPFYHARDVAIKRGQIEGAPVVLGSATPALETWRNAGSSPHYERLDLPERVPGARAPAVRVVDVHGRDTVDGASILAPELLAEVGACVAAGDQAILLHNRRGYAAFLRCTRCGLLVGCDRCGANLVYHRVGEKLKCHRCGWSRALPDECVDDTCGGKLERTGMAVQRLEEELARKLPAARLLRLDSDTMRKRDDYAAALGRFAQHEADILLGTQMVAKGLDFPGVRLVGVIDADAAMRLPTFRAAEQAFQLIMQVAGRAGRKEGDSLALVQTEDPESPIWRAAVRMDYPQFAEQELPLRQELFDPPYARLIRFICLDPQPKAARDAAETLARAMASLATKLDARIRIDRASACVMARLRELHRYQVVARLPREMHPARLLTAARQEKLLRPRVKRFTIDVDPLDLL